MNINCLNFRSMSFLKHFSTNTRTHSMLTHTHTGMYRQAHTQAHGAIKRIKRFKAQNAAIKIVCSLISCVLVVFFIYCSLASLLPPAPPHLPLLLHLFSFSLSLSLLLSFSRLPCLMRHNFTLAPPLSLFLHFCNPQSNPHPSHTHTQKLQLRLYSHTHTHCHIHLINVHARHTHTHTLIQLHVVYIAHHTRAARAVCLFCQAIKAFAWERKTARMQ